ncbi:MFS transporter [Alloiococcus sp. CFN-8]|uniref:MFS transporter n=1 Tax=Alloiococcus sp. CFN-8 TaxID=3416081 RepID=UPI003CEE54A2
MKDKMHRWIILAACFLIMAVAFSIVNSVHSLFIDTVTKERGFSLSSFSLIFTIAGITTGIVSPFIGRLIRKTNIKLVMALGSIIGGLGFAAYGLISALPGFYILAVLISIGITALTTIPISTLINYWFKEQRGMALGIAFAGIGTGSFFWMQIASYLIEKAGYRWAYIILGAAIVVITLPLILIFIKLPKEKIQEKVVNSEDGEVKASSFMSLSFIAFSAGLLLLGIAVAGTKVHAQPYLNSVGYSIQKSANIGSLQAIFALVGNALGGIVFDKLSLRKSITIFTLLSLISYVSLLLIRIPYVSVLYALSFGLFMCMPSVLPSYGASALFKGENYSEKIGVVNMVFTLGSAFGSFLSGFIADIRGYGFAWFIYIIISLSYLVLFFITFRKKVDI